MNRFVARELAALRQEIRALREKTGDVQADKADPAAAGQAERDGADWSTLRDEIKELNATIQDAIEGAEAGVSRHPVASVAAAFAIGLVVGRIVA